MPGYGDVIYQPKAVWVATLNSDNTYGTPARIEYVQKVNWKTMQDEDDLKAYGVLVEGLTIVTGAEGSIDEAALDEAAYPILTSLSSTASGASPDEKKTLDMQGGGSGFPYVGWIVEYAATQNAGAVVGFCKAQLKTWPEFDVEQNKFRRGSLPMKMFAGNTTARKIFRQRKYEDAASVPDFSVPAGFDTFLGPLFS